jgi:hypothetical protein
MLRHKKKVRPSNPYQFSGDLNIQLGKYWHKVENIEYEPLPPNKLKPS